MADGKSVMVVGFDDSEHSVYALEWTLDHFFRQKPPLFKLVVVHSKATPSSVVGLAGPGNSLTPLEFLLIVRGCRFLTYVEADLKKCASRVVEKAKEICASRSVNNVVVEVGEGDARSVLCDAVDKHHATMLVLGSHGYGALKRVVLGSVSDYCTYNAHCNVMIVKKPKSNH